MPAITNYDFIDEETPIKFSELLEGEAITKIKLQNVLEVLNKQNRCLKGKRKRCNYVYSRTAERCADNY